MRMSKIVSCRWMGFLGLAILMGCQGSQTAQVSKARGSDTVEELGDLISELINDRIRSEESPDDSMELAAVALFRVYPLPVNEQTEESYRRYRKTQAALLKSPYVLNTALRDPKINQLPLLVEKEDLLGWIQSRIHTSATAESEIVRVELRGNEGEEEQLTEILDAIVDAYVNECSGTERNRSAETLDLVRSRSRDLMRQINRTQTNLDVLQRMMPIGPDGEPSADVRRLKHRVVLSQERITELSLRRDDLTLQLAEVAEQDETDRDTVRRTLATLDELMNTVESEYASNGKALYTLLTASSTGEWAGERLKMEVDIQQYKKLMAVEAAITFEMREASRVQLIQRALITRDEDPDGEKAWKKELEDLKQKLRDESLSAESVMTIQIRGINTSPFDVRTLSRV